jgi:hypothetical protein
MNKALKVIPLFLLVVFASSAQHGEPADFIPIGFKEFEKKFGDLNGDGLRDCVMLIKKTDTAMIKLNQNGQKVDRNRRGILVLFKNDKGYHLVDKNYECFSSENEDGGVYYAPELSITIEDKKLKLYYGHGRYGNFTFIFKFQNQIFELIGYEQTDLQGPYILQEKSINFLTRKKLIRKNTYEPKDEFDMKEVFIETWSDVNIERLIKLSEVEDFDELNMYVY